jgi:hypothetical protein
VVGGLQRGDGYVVGSVNILAEREGDPLVAMLGKERQSFGEPEAKFGEVSFVTAISL